MNSFPTDNDEARPGGVGMGELTDPYLRAKVVMLSWLSWLAPSLVLKVRPSSYGEERRARLQSTNNCLFCFSTNCNGYLYHGFFFLGLSALRFAMDRFRLDPAGKSSRTFYRRNDEKKMLFFVCFVLRSLRLPWYLPVDWNQVWECLAIFLKMPSMHWKTVVTLNTRKPVD